MRLYLGDDHLLLIWANRNLHDALLLHNKTKPYDSAYITQYVVLSSQIKK